MSIPAKLFKALFSLLLMVLTTSAIVAQPDADTTKKTYYGGSFGAQFGNETALELSPLIGYRVTQNFSVGAGISYIYYSYTNPNYAFLNYHTSIYGGRVFAKEYVYSYIFGYAEFEILNLERQNQLTGDLHRVTTANPLVGGGISQAMGGGALMNLMILWDVNPDVASPYTNPIFRIGFTF